MTGGRARDIVVPREGVTAWKSDPLRQGIGSKYIVGSCAKITPDISHPHGRISPEL
jgi:hypothetical protein